MIKTNRLNLVYLLQSGTFFHYKVDQDLPQIGTDVKKWGRSQNYSNEGQVAQSVASITKMGITVHNQS